MLTQEIFYLRSQNTTFSCAYIYILSYVKNHASSNINKASDCHGTRIQVPGLVVLFTFFCIYFHPSFFTHTLLYKNAWKYNIRFHFFLILLHSAYFHRKEIKYVYLVIESNHFSNNCFINSRKQCIPNKLHIFC